MINFDTDDTLLCFQIPHHFIHQLMHDHVLSAEFEINKTEVRTLMSMRREGPMTMQSLGHLVGISKGSLTPVVDKLICLKLAQRSNHPDDRRKVLVAITAKGMETATILDKELRSYLDSKFSVLSDEERKALFQSLQTIHTITAKLKG
jgi:DNA-binding MarR family transcriptional regulator